MRREIKIGVLTLLMSFIVFVGVSRAQTQSCQKQFVCSIYTLYYGDCIPHLPLGAHNCASNGPWSAICNGPTFSCSPTPCPTCGTGEASGPIDLATGNTYIEESDIRIPGLGGGLSLTRRWNSQTTSYGMFGLGWTSNVEQKIYVGGDYLVKHLRGDGSIWSYGFSSYSPDGSTVEYLLAGPRNGNATAQQGSSTFTITQKSGEQQIFDSATGILLSSADRNGNKTTYSYNSSNQLVSVTDPASRHLYFSYSQVGQFNAVTSVTTDVGLSVSYQYDSLGRLVQVTAPDNTFTVFAYNAAGLITGVTDSNGKTIESHTYDALGRGVTASRAGGVEAVTVSYSY